LHGFELGQIKFTFLVNGCHYEVDEKWDFFSWSRRNV